jgi:transcriptional regulator with XRE-family HTH domain
MDHFDLTGRQIAAARTLVGKTQAEIAKAANISVPTLKRMEASPKTISGIPNNVKAVVDALREAGVQFMKPGEVCTGLGVALSLEHAPFDPRGPNDNYAEARLAA